MMWFRKMIDSITDADWKATEATMIPHEEGKTEIVGLIPQYMRDMIVARSNIQSVSGAKDDEKPDFVWLVEQQATLATIIMTELRHAGFNVEKDVRYQIGIGWQLLKVLPEKQPIIVVPDAETVKALGSSQVPEKLLKSPKQRPSTMRVGA